MLHAHVSATDTPAPTARAAIAVAAPPPAAARAAIPVAAPPPADAWAAILGAAPPPAARAAAALWHIAEAGAIVSVVVFLINIIKSYNHKSSNIVPTAVTKYSKRSKYRQNCALGYQ